MYDVPKSDKPAERPDRIDKSAVRKDAFETQKQVNLLMYFYQLQVFGICYFNGVFVSH